MWPYLSSLPPKSPDLRGYVDGTIVFGNSILTLILQLQLVEKTEYAGAFSALALAAFYIFLSRYLFRHKNANYRMLAQAFISIVSSLFRSPCPWHLME